ncbi:MAG: ketoacid-CoA transferase [Chloroflexota bacterium]
MSELSCTIDETMCVCIARQVRDGEAVAQGLATPLVAAGYLLAWHTHAPNLYFASAIGQSLCREGAPLGLATVEALWLDRALHNFGFVQAAADLLPRVRPKEFFRPGQVDPFGNFNNLAFGRDHRRPRLRLPGSGGIPDVTPVLSEIYLYVPRHSRVTFVEHLDFLSGLGHHPARRRGAGPRYLVSDLGQFDFASGRMRLTHVHAGVTPERVQAKTGFPLEFAPTLLETEPPTSEELDILRRVVDPLGVRCLEFLSGPERRRLMLEILHHERNSSRTIEDEGTSSGSKAHTRALDPT